MEKSGLRRKFIGKRLSLSDKDCQTYSRKIASLFAANTDAKVSFVHHYYPIAGKKEVDCLLLVNSIIEVNPAVRIAAPRVNTETGGLDSVEIVSNTRFVRNKWGIVEPEGPNMTDEAAFDLVLVPLLCFDRSGHRVGYGKGYYDRLLAKCRPDCRKVGLSFFGPVDAIDGIHDKDVRLDSCVTPEGVFDFTG